MGANAEFVRRWVDAWNRGDDGMLLEGVGPEFEWVVAREHPDATTHRGPDAAAAYLADWRRMLPDLEVQIEELLEAGERVLLVMRMTGTGAGSGAVTEVRVATISAFREGRPVRTEEFLDPEAARRAFAGT